MKTKTCELAISLTLVAVRGVGAACLLLGALGVMASGSPLFGVLLGVAAFATAGNAVLDLAETLD